MPLPPWKPPPCWLRWRDELVVIRVAAAARDEVLIEDPVSGKFHRLGAAEFAIASELDGTRSLTDTANAVAEREPRWRLKPEALEALERWLLSSGLVETWIQGQRRTLTRPATIGTTQSILCWRWSWGNPDVWLRRLTPWLSWLFCWPVVVAGTLGMALAALAVGLHYDEFTMGLDRVWHPDQHVRLLACWIVLKICHELGHGVACQRLGGDVRECGVTFMYFAPVPYVDVTSSWRLSSRWQRMAIAAAGMYVEWLVAAAAVAVWFCSTNSAVQQSAVYVASLASVATLLFNANPLFRFDGYFILTDLLHWPNLSTQGQLLARAWWAHWWFGVPRASVALSPRAERLATVYGLAAWGWRTIMMVSMAVLALILYEAFGALLVGATFYVGLIRPWQKRRAQLGQLPQLPTRHWGRFAVRLAFTAGVLGALAVVPWWGTVSAPGVVQPSDWQVVRAPCDGFIERLEVVDGQTVVAGQALAVMSNPTLLLEREQLELSARLAEVKLRALRQRRELVEMQAEEGKLAALREQLGDVRRRCEALTIRAASAGHVVGRTLHDRPGSFLKEGAELCAIAGEELEVLVAIADHDVTTFRQRLGAELEVALPGGARIGRLRVVDPRASHTAHDRSLLAPYGGPLPATRTNRPDEASEPWELTQPHFLGRITLEPQPDAAPLGSGQRAVAQFRPFEWRLIEQLWRHGERWLDQQQHEHGRR